METRGPLSLFSGELDLIRVVIRTERHCGDRVIYRMFPTCEGRGRRERKTGKGEVDHACHPLGPTPSESKPVSTSDSTLANI
ncbi:hypothetical protein AOLI_G00231180 [Acnodon oligacanthus]